MILPNLAMYVFLNIKYRRWDSFLKYWWPEIEGENNLVRIHAKKQKNDLAQQVKKFWWFCQIWLHIWISNIADETLFLDADEWWLMSTGFKGMNDILIFTKLLKWSIVSCTLKCLKVAKMAKKHQKYQISWQNLNIPSKIFLGCFFEQRFSVLNYILTSSKIIEKCQK